MGYPINIRYPINQPIPTWAARAAPPKSHAPSPPPSPHAPPESSAARSAAGPWQRRRRRRSAGGLSRRGSWPNQPFWRPKHAKTGRIHLDLAWKNLKLEGIFGFFGRRMEGESQKTRSSIRNSFKIFKKIISSFGFQSFWEWNMNKIKHREGPPVTGMMQTLTEAKMPSPC